MSRQLFVNLPVENIAATRAFFAGLGFEFDDQFGDRTTACMAVNDSAWVILLEKARFRDFINDDICDTARSREVLVCISADDREGVDSLVDAALAAGGSKWTDPLDHGFMYQRSFRDLDNHVWEVMWMDPAAAGQ